MVLGLRSDRMFPCTTVVVLGVWGAVSWFVVYLLISSGSSSCPVPCCCLQTAPDLHQHLHNARPPKPRQGWSYVVHPVGAEARARNRWELEQRRRDQYLDVEETYSWYEGVEPGQLGAVEGFDPALDPKAPAEPYVAMPGRRFRGLNEEESVVVGYSKAKPRRRWSKR